MKKFALILAAAIALYGCNSQNPSSASAAKDQSVSTEGKKPVPQFDLAKVSGGSLKAADLKGKVTVLDFWATWCESCIPEIPGYNAIQAKYGDKIEMLGVTMDSGSADDIKAKAQEFKVNYPLLVGDDKVVEGFGGLIGYPTTFVISKDGNIYKKYLGAPPGKQERILKDIETLLAAEPAQEKPKTVAPQS